MRAGGLNPGWERGVVRSMAPPVYDPRPKATIADAMRYMVALNNEFAFAEPEKYEEIVGVLRAFIAASMDTAGVVARMEELLSGHRGLLHYFNKFLPWSYIRAHGPAGGNIH
ncbi:unnamed protein product [Urochloa decumbens]|uniref:Uncharacterized protein n=1 Tax=Urochloa decumbens TaxID=240449 RepID=A0ABC9BT21_9POAL